MNIPFSKYYESSKATIVNAKRHIAFAILVFILGIIIGFNFFKGSNTLYASFTNLTKNILSDNYMMLVSNLFIHNIIICYLSLRLGIFLGVLPIFSSLITGISIGWLFSIIPIGFHLTTLALLLPHGIFELPALFLSCGVGIWRTKLLFVPNYEKAAKENVRLIHYLFVFIIFPLILIAAFIESMLFFILR